MEVISVIVMFIFGNMNDQEHRMTQYVPMESLSSCMKEVRILKKKETDYTKDAFCGPALVELSDDGEILTLHTEIPEGAKMVRKKMIQETSLEAYKVLTPELGNLQETVYNTIIDHPGMSNHDIARYLNWEINRVTPRVKELRDKGLVILSHHKEDSITERRVICWKTI